MKKEEVKKEEAVSKLKPLMKQKPAEKTVLDEWESFMADTKKNVVKKDSEDLLDQYSD